MKKVLILLSILILCVGCTRIDNTENKDLIVDFIMQNQEKKANTTSLGYKYYLPIGVSKIYDKDYNQKFKVDNNYIYLYADIVSYYYKNKLNFTEEKTDAYYYKEINNNDKTGYIKITKEENKYYIKIVYNYAKIESYVKLTEINKILAHGMIILDSIDYNDTLIKNIIDDEYSISTDKEYKIDKPEDAESKFSEYLSEDIPEEEVVPDLPEY